jgi:Cytochrome c554 and c-prime
MTAAPARLVRCAAFLLALTAASVAQTTQATTRPVDDRSCGTCHGKEAGLHAAGVHKEAGVGCVACHGGDPSLTSRAACIDNPHFKGVPKGAAAVEMCGTCHSDPDAMFRYGLPTDQLAAYRRSHHGKGLFERGDKNVPTCVDCHEAHDVRSKTDPESPSYRSKVPDTCATCCHGNEEKMKPYKLPADVFDKYSKSVHGKGLLAGKQLRLPNCSDCHSAHGARPAGVAEVSDVCGQCHTATREYFKKSPHFAAAKAGKMQECTSCHRYHDIDEVPDFVTEGWRPLACAECHPAGASGDKGAVVAKEMADLMGRLKKRVADTAAKIDEARAKGIVVRAEETYLNDARHSLVMSGPVGHAASIDEFNVLARKADGVVAKVEETLAVKLRNVRDRRIVAVIVVGVVAVFAAVLFVIVGRSSRRRAPVREAAEVPR